MHFRPDHGPLDPGRSDRLNLVNTFVRSEQLDGDYSLHSPPYINTGSTDF